jgi:hypothetical protein
LLEAIKARTSTLLLPLSYTDNIHNVIVSDVLRWAECYYLQGLDRGIAEPIEWAKEFVAVFGYELSLIAALVKHPKFSGEAERRIATHYQDGDLKDLIFRQKRTLLARHLPLDIKIVVENALQLPITRVMVGPGPAQKVTKIGVGDLLLKHGYKNIPVELSKVPYRIP